MIDSRPATPRRLAPCPTDPRGALATGPHAAEEAASPAVTPFDRW